MTSTQMSSEHAVQVPAAATVDLKLEVVVIPVSDVDRAKRFYEGLGWRLDADFAGGENWRVVQFTPPGSPCSIHFGKGRHDGSAGLIQESLSRGVRHRGGTRGAQRPRRRRERRRSISPRSADHPRRAPTRKAPPMEPLPRSAIPTATAGCCRRSRRGCPDEDSAVRTSRL